MHALKFRLMEYPSFQVSLFYLFRQTEANIAVILSFRVQ
jgi:hypothetical protein